MTTEEMEAADLDDHQEHDEPVEGCDWCDDERRQAAIDLAAEFCADELTTAELRMAMEGLPI